jgi:hypothetical protein
MRRENDELRELLNQRFRPKLAAKLRSMGKAVEQALHR